MSEAMTGYLRVAQVLKSNGTDGEVILGFRNFAPEEIDLKEPVFIVFDGLPVPFFIESLKQKGVSKALARLTGIKTLEDADELAGKEVFAKEEAISRDVEDDVLTMDDLKGWTVLSPDGKSVGTVSGWEDIPSNPCLYVNTPSGEIMLPFHEDLMVDMDEEGEKITLRIPEGLI